MVREQIYTRIVEFAHHKPIFYHQELSDEQKAVLADVYTNEHIYGGKSLEAWVAAKLHRAVCRRNCEALRYRRSRGTMMRTSGLALRAG